MPSPSICPSYSKATSILETLQASHSSSEVKNFTDIIDICVQNIFTEITERYLERDRYFSYPQTAILHCIKMMEDIDNTNINLRVDDIQSILSFNLKHILKKTYTKDPHIDKKIKTLSKELTFTLDKIADQEISDQEIRRLNKITALRKKLLSRKDMLVPKKSSQPVALSPTKRQQPPSHRKKNKQRRRKTSQHLLALSPKRKQLASLRNVSPSLLKILMVRTTPCKSFDIILTKFQDSLSS